MIKKLFFKNIHTQNALLSNFEYKVSLIQRPGDSEKRHVTMIPGEGIGKELYSIKSFVYFF